MMADSNKHHRREYTAARWLVENTTSITSLGSVHWIVYMTVAILGTRLNRSNIRIYF